MLLQDGALMAAWKFSGPDLASATFEEMDALTRRLNNVLRLGSSWMIHCDTIRSEAPDYPVGGAFPDGVTRLIDEERRAQFMREGSHYESEYFLVLTYLPPAETEEKLLGFLFEGGNEENTSKSVAAQALEYFNNKVGVFHEVFASQFKAKRLKSRTVSEDFGFKVVYDDLLRYVRRCVSGENFAFVQPEIPVFLHDQIGARELSCGLELKLGDQHIRVVAIDGFPHTTYPGLLAALDALPFEYRWNTRAILLDPEHSKPLIMKHVKKWRAKTRGFLDQLMGRVSKSVDEYAVANVNDGNAAWSEASAGDVQFCYYSSNIILMDKDAARADKRAAQVVKTLMNLAFDGRLETVNAIEAWRGSLPGDGYSNVRRVLLHTLNLADCLPIAAIWTGERFNPCGMFPPNSPPLMYATGVGASAFKINLHVSDLGHTLVLGPPGSGKSTLLATLAAQFFRYPKAQVFCFDKGYSMFALNQASNGEFYDLGGPDSQLNFCPLGELEDPSDMAWAVDYVETLCINTGQQVSPQQRNEIMDGINTLRQSPERTLTELVINIQDREIKSALKAYTLLGSLGGLLEAAQGENAFGEAPFMVFEMEHLMNYGDNDKAVVAVLLYLFRQIEKRLDGSPTLIILDEAWVYLKNEMFRNKILDWLKTFRKKNATVIFATQSISDIINSPIRDAMLESCPTKILLANPEAGNENSREFYRQLGLNMREISMVQSAQPKVQYYFYSPAGRRLVSLGLGPVTLSFVGVSDIDSRRSIKRMMAVNPKTWQEQWLRHRGLARWADHYVAKCLPLSASKSSSKSNLIAIARAGAK
jgi:type IV secretion system protein VirB4